MGMCLCAATVTKAILFPPPNLGAIIAIVVVGVLAVVFLVLLGIGLVYLCRLRRKIKQTRPEDSKLKWTDVIGEVKLDVNVSPREEDCVHSYLGLSHTQRFSGVFQTDGSTEETDGSTEETEV